MDKRTRKTNKALEHAKKCVDLEYNRITKKEEPQPTQKPIVTVAMAKLNDHNYKIVKIQKGLFKIEKDGEIVEKRFKSITKAKEWIIKQQ